MTQESDIDQQPTEPTGLPVPEKGPHVAKGAPYYRNVRIVLVLLMIVGGLWFLRDGFIKYPEENRFYTETQAKIEAANELEDTATVALLSDQLKGKKFHNALDLTIQRAIGFTLIPLAGLAAFLWYRRCRGEYRLDEADVLHAPGHPPISARDITDIDDDRWEKKGISVITYADAGEEKTLRLDDFVYDRPPITRIHDRLVHVTGKGEIDYDNPYSPDLEEDDEDDRD